MKQKCQLELALARMEQQQQQHIKYLVYNTTPIWIKESAKVSSHQSHLL